MSGYSLSSLEKDAVLKGCVCRRNEPMSSRTTFRIGGPAELFVEPGGIDALKFVIGKCSREGIPFFILGNGSNLLVSDKGIEGAVIHIGAAMSAIRKYSDTEIECEAGARLMTACGFALDSSLGGLEFAYGIPGSIGGAVYMNAGAYGGEMKDVVTRCKHISSDGSEKEFGVQELEFGYRSSVYSSGGGVVASVIMTLHPAKHDEIQAKMKELFSRRTDKQPLDLPSAGSVFKRPEGYFAGALIEQAGLKGFSVGGAAVSQKHAGFIVNRGGATCDDVLRLIECIRERVLSTSGVELECEIKKAGR